MSLSLRQHYEWLVGTRYLRSGNRRGFLSFITLISAVGLALGVAVLLVVMSVMNGFESELRARILTVTSLEMPDIDTELIEDPDPSGPFGGKEVGQGPLLPIMPALANAIFDATGVRIDEVPITPEKILKGLANLQAGKPARVGPKGFPAVPYPEPLQVPTPWQGGDGRAVNEAVRAKDKRAKNV